MSTKGTTFIKSPYKLAYLILFGLTMHSIWNDTKSFPVNAITTNDINNFSFYFSFFILILLFHMFRIYITTEMMDDKEYIFEDFFINAGKIQKFIEYILRLIILLVISCKIIHWNNINKNEWLMSFCSIFINLNFKNNEIPMYLFLLYSSMFLWGCVVLSFRVKSYEWKLDLKTILSSSTKSLFDVYLVTSIIGIWACFQLSETLSQTEISNSVGILTSRLMIIIGMYLVEFFIDGYRNWEKYLSYIKQIGIDIGLCKN